LRNPCTWVKATIVGGECCRIKEDGTYAATTWQVKFNLDTIADSGIYKFRMATAASSNAAIQVLFSLSEIFLKKLSSCGTFEGKWTSWRREINIKLD